MTVMSIHASPSRNAQLKRIQRDQTTQRPPTDKQVAEAFIKAKLYYAATVQQNPEAREQLRLLSRVTEQAHEAYMAQS